MFCAASVRRAPIRPCVHQLMGDFMLDRERSCLYSIPHGLQWAIAAAKRFQYESFYKTFARKQSCIDNRRRNRNKLTPSRSDLQQLAQRLFFQAGHAGAIRTVAAEIGGHAVHTDIFA